MSESRIVQQISQKGSDKEKVAEQVIKNPGLLPEVFAGLEADKARIKYGCEKILRLISEKNPGVIYPYFDFFTEMLNSENNFLKWGTIHTIANLTAVDSENKFEKIFDKYFYPIPGPVLITAANVIGGAAKIALAKPELTGKISKEILKVEKAKYQTEECRNVAIGHAVNSYHQFFHQIEDKEPVITFVKKQLKSTRNAVRKKAEKFLKKYL